LDTISEPSQWRLNRMFLPEHQILVSGAFCTSISFLHRT
jgi:hypothetical protein